MEGKKEKKKIAMFKLGSLSKINVGLNKKKEKEKKRKKERKRNKGNRKK